MQQAQSRRNYLGAVALNNSAVLLLERGHHRQALAVLEDAVATMREVMLLTTGGTTPMCRNDDDDFTIPRRDADEAQWWMEASAFPPRGVGPPLEQMLQRASQHVMDSGPGAPSAPSSEGPGAESQVLDVDMSQLILRPLDKHFPSTSGANLMIRIDAIQCRGLEAGSPDDDGGGGGDGGGGDGPADRVGAAGPHLESLTILHNYAVAACRHPIPEQDLRRGAVRATHVAFGHVCRLILHKWNGYYDARSGSGSGSSGGPYEAVALLQLSVLLARCTYQLCCELGDAHGAGRSLDQYRAVQTAMDSEEVRFATILGTMSVPHAKAA